MRGYWAGHATAVAVVVLVGCGDSGPFGSVGAGSSDALQCSIPTSEIFNGGPGKDGIPALTDPTLVAPDEVGAQYLRDGDRVIGIDLGGQRVAVPLNITWWHEIVNMRIDTFALAVTHCPLTGSSLVFDRGALGGAEFGVSGLLYRNNLIMCDRSTQESMWPQMARGARCGPRSGSVLTSIPFVEMTWAGWKALHPDTRVVSSTTSYSRDYRRYPYGDYDELDNPMLLFPIQGGIDSRRPPKERVLGIPERYEGGVAFPFGELSAAGTVAVAVAALPGRSLVVFWDGSAEGAMAYESVLEDGTTLTFRIEGDRITDEQTGSRWRLDGQAIEGPLVDQRLTPVADAYVAYWFAWAAFHRRADLWTSG